MCHQTPTYQAGLHYLLKTVFPLVDLHIRCKKLPAPWFDNDGFAHWSNEYFEYTLRISHLGMPVLIKEEIEITRSTILFLHVPLTLKIITQLLADADWI